MKKNISKVFVSYANSIKQPIVRRMRFDKIIHFIKNDKFKRDINTIRNISDKDIRSKTKRDLLPYFTFTKFKNNHRSNNNFRHVKYIIFDVDNLSKRKLKTLKMKVKSSNEVYCSFVSPSNNGLKIIQRLNRKITNINEYRLIYQYCGEQISLRYNITIDNTSDPARTCYLSYDPKIMYNPQCKDIDVEEISVKVKKIFNKKVTKEHIDLSLLPDIINFLTGKIDYKEWIKCGFALASIGEAGRHHYINLSINHPNYTDEASDINKIFSDLLERYDSCRTHIYSIFHLAENKGFDINKVIDKVFWSYEHGRLEINRTALLDFLKTKGFGKIELNNKYYKVYLKNNRLREIDTVFIKNYVIEYLTQSNNLDVKEKILRGVTSYFSEKLIELLHIKTIKFKVDTANKSYIFFQNCYVEVSSRSIRKRDYHCSDGVIWERQIINHNFLINKDKSVFFKFIKNVCKSDRKRINALKSSIGYLLHNYKNPSMTKAIIFCDEKISEGAFGRSGKSLIGKAVSQVRNTSSIDARLFHFNTNFVYQEVNINTQIIHFNDASRHFPFQKLFSSITDGLRLEKKNKDAITIPFECSPKFLLSTNYVIQGEDDSSLDRKFEIEFSNYYNMKHKPIYDFQKLFFDNWDEGEWNSFYILMMRCLKLYLKEGLMPYQHINLNMRKLIEATSTEFAKFIQTINKQNEFNIKRLYKSFKEYYDDVENCPKQNTFSKWLDMYGRIYSIRIKQRSSSGKKFIKFIRVSKN